MTPAADSLVVLAVDKGGTRLYLAGKGPDGPFKPWVPGEALPVSGSVGKGFVYVWPTRTYSEGMGSDKPAELAPEDRAMIRAARRAHGGELACFKAGEDGGEASAVAAPKGALTFDSSYVKNMKAIFVSCMTRPNRQDYMWLATKTFSFNLAIRLFFVSKAVGAGELPMFRAVISTSWYQIQDAVFTVFGQTYMKFLGNMTGMIRIFSSPVGDMVFVYVQLCGFEFLNRLVLGPLGENPLVYTPAGIGLIFLNIMQGMLSGGPLIPAVNQMRRVGAISHSTMMHLYQVTSLTMQFGLFAAFGYQRFYALLTGSVLVLSWTSYFVFTTFYKDPEFTRADGETAARLSGLAAA
ncbi:MAG: hypothetical protein HYZ75_00180 [Elusimicrobia bacterium]|nr:hypothetical protein [Elusimicrobiota bacterium]